MYKWNEFAAFLHEYEFFIYLTHLIDDPNVPFVADEADETVNNVDFGSNETAG